MSTFLNVGKPTKKGNQLLSHCQQRSFLPPPPQSQMSVGVIGFSDQWKWGLKGDRPLQYPRGKDIIGRDVSLHLLWTQWPSFITYANFCCTSTNFHFVTTLLPSSHPLALPRDWELQLLETKARHHHGPPLQGILKGTSRPLLKSPLWKRSLTAALSLQAPAPSPQLPLPSTCPLPCFQNYAKGWVRLGVGGEITI